MMKNNSITTETNNLYIGMSEHEIDRLLQLKKEQIDHANEIRHNLWTAYIEKEEEIKTLQSELRQLNNAKKYECQMEYTNILVVESDYGVLYEGKTTYEFAVYSVNKDNHLYASELLLSSRTDYNYRYHQPYVRSKELKELLLKVIDDYGVTHVYFDRGCKIAQTDIKNRIGRAIRIVKHVEIPYSTWFCTEKPPFQE